MRTIELPVQVGMWDTRYIARVYPNHTVILSPYVKWRGDNGSLDFEKSKLPERPKHLHYLSSDKIDAFWAWAGRELDDSYLTNQEF